MEQKWPLVMEAATASLLCGTAAGESCLQQWMLRHPAQVSELQQAFLDAGAQALCAPTGGTNALGLSALELPPDEVRKLNAALVTLTAQVAGGRPVLGYITSAGHLPEPSGPLPYTDLIDIYAEQALELAGADASALLLSGFSHLANMRAAVLGARQARLPMAALLDVDVDEGVDPLAALLCIQELGVDTFGVVGSDMRRLAQTLERLAPYAHVTLAAGVQADLQTPEEMARECFELLAAGARHLFACDGVTPQHMQALCGLGQVFEADAFPLPRRETLSPIWLTGGKTPYFLDADFTCSPPVKCWPDMSEPILEGEGSGADALLYRVTDVKDAYYLGQNAHKAHGPAAIWADSEEALEMALLYYPGRALIHPASTVSGDVKQALAKGYGAVNWQGAVQM